jgi:hypothetical protein
MEPSAAAIRVREAIPTTVRVAGWLLILGPLLAFIAERPDEGRQLRLVGQSLALLGLGDGIVPLEFLVFTWVAVAVVFWAQAHVRGSGLGRKSSLVVVAALVSQAMLFLMTRAA